MLFGDAPFRSESLRAERQNGSGTRWTALQFDRARLHPDAAKRAKSDALVALLTPVIKAGFTDMGFESAVAAQQVFGGHGYIREWGMEQYVRDARIAQIYEGHQWRPGYRPRRA